MKIYWFFKDIILGIRWGIPLCCIWEFTMRRWRADRYDCMMDSETEEKANWLIANNIEIDHMPCDKCFEELKKKKPLL